MGNGIPVQNVSYTPEGMKILSLNGADSIIIRSFEVNGRSDAINNYDDYIGLVLYGYNGKSQWSVNGKSCESGFILIKKVNNIKYESSKYWNSGHSKLYKWYFGVDPDYTKVVGAGFAYKTEKRTDKNDEGDVVREYNVRDLVFRSSTFNAFDNIKSNFEGTEFKDYKDEYHDTKREMNIIEQYWVRKAFDSWKQNGYRSKKVFCNAATWKFRKNQSWIEYNYYDSVYIEKQYQIYMKKKNESDDDDEKFDKERYSVIRYMNGTKYYIYFNAPHIKQDMYGYESSDGYQQSHNGCIRAMYRSSNQYTGNTGCVIL